MNNFKTPEEVLDFLAKTYGQDQGNILQRTVQLQNENVKQYISRLRTSLGTIGITELSSPQVVLDCFVKGLLPNISHRVKSLFPTSIANAVGTAYQVELDLQNFKITNPSNLNVLEDCNKHNPGIPKQILNELNAIKSQLKVKDSQKNNNTFEKNLNENMNLNTKRFDNELSDLKFEINNVQRDLELQKDRDYHTSLDSKADFYSKNSRKVRFDNNPQNIESGSKNNSWRPYYLLSLQS